MDDNAVSQPLSESAQLPDCRHPLGVAANPEYGFTRRLADEAHMSATGFPNANDQISFNSEQASSGRRRSPVNLELVSAARGCRQGRLACRQRNRLRTAPQASYLQPEHGFQFQSGTMPAPGGAMATKRV